MNNLKTLVRAAIPEDIPAIYQLLSAFANDQGVESSFHLTEERLAHLVESHGLDALLSTHNDKIVGVITFYETVSTFLGVIGLHIEDMYISKDFQRMGIGKQFMDAMIDETKRRGFKKLSWQALRDNMGAIQFYQKMGALQDNNWITFNYNIEY